MWFDGWNELVRIAVVGSAAYLTLVLILRFSGKRTLGKLNAFDLAISVALGSALATVLLSEDISWSEGALAFTVLAFMQFLVAFVSGHLPNGRSLVTARPTLVLRDGQPDHHALDEQRLTLDELRQAVRSTGVGGFDKVAAVVMESDGSLSVIPDSQRGDASALEGIQGWDESSGSAG